MFTVSVATSNSTDLRHITLPVCLPVSASFGILAYCEQLPLAYRKCHVHRSLTDDRRKRLAGRGHEITDRKREAADSARDRGLDVGVAQFEFAALEGGLKPLQLAERQIGRAHV